MVGWSLCGGCRVHSGFLDSWNSAKPEIESALTTAQSKYPEYEIVATGHSLGAAVATVAAADLRSTGKNVALVSEYVVQCGIVLTIEVYVRITHGWQRPTSNLHYQTARW